MNETFVSVQTTDIRIRDNDGLNKKLKSMIDEMAVHGRIISLSHSIAVHHYEEGTTLSVVVVVAL